MRTTPVIPLLLVAILAFTAGAFWFGGQAETGPDFVPTTTPGPSMEGDRMERAPALPAGILMHSRELVGTDSGEPRSRAPRDLQLDPPAQSVAGVAGVFGELDALAKRGGISNHDLKGFREDLVRGLIKEGDPMGALRVLDLYGKGVIEDKRLYLLVLRAMDDLELSQDSLTLNLRFLAAWPDIDHPLKAVRLVSPQLALDVLRQNHYRLSSFQQELMGAVEVDLLIELGRAAEAREVLDRLLLDKPASYALLSVMFQLAPLEARALVDELYGQDPQKWAIDYVDLLEANGDKERALEVLREAMMDDGDQEHLFGQLLRISPLEGYTYLVNQGAPKEGDSDACRRWRYTAQELANLGHLDQAIDLGRAALASPGHDYEGYNLLLELAPGVLAEAMAVKIGESMHLDSLESLAMAYWSAGQMADAIDVLKKCMEISGDEEGYNGEITAIELGEEPGLWTW